MTASDGGRRERRKPRARVAVAEEVEVDGGWRVDE